MLLSLKATTAQRKRAAVGRLRISGDPCREGKCRELETLLTSGTRLRAPTRTSCDEEAGY